MKRKCLRNISIILATVLLLGSFTGCSSEMIDSVQDKPKETETTITDLKEEDICDAYSGIDTLYIKEGIEDIDYLYNVIYDSSIIKGIKVDDTEVDVTKEGKYKIKYEVEVDFQALNEYKNKQLELESSTVKVVVEKDVVVVNEKEAQDLSDKDIPVYTGKNETVKKSDGTEVVVKQETPASVSVTGGTTVNASTSKKTEAETSSGQNKTVQESNSAGSATTSQTTNNTATTEKSQSSSVSASNNTTASKPSTSSANTASSTTSKPATSSSSSNNTSSSSASSTPAHTHTWVDVTKTVEHPAETHQEDVYETQQVLVSDAWDEKVYVETRLICVQCGFTTTSSEEMGDHLIENAHSCRSEDIYDTVHHDAVYETRQVKVGTKTVVDKEAWTETVVTGQKCSTCGATK